MMMIPSDSEESTGATTSVNHPKLQFIWGTTMYHLDDLPFDSNALPDVYTIFRKACYFNWRLFVE